MADYIVKEKVFIPPYEGRGVRVKAGQFLKIVDVEGKQVGISFVLMKMISASMYHRFI